MELFGIIFSFPAAFGFSAVYSFAVKRITLRWDRISHLLLWASLLILALLILEFIGVLTVGPLTLRAAVGSFFYPVHVALFFLAVPSLANTLQLQRASPYLSKWYITALACAIVGLSVVLLQYHVSESLYGIDGTTGPYS